MLGIIIATLLVFIFCAVCIILAGTITIIAAYPIPAVLIVLAIIAYKHPAHTRMIATRTKSQAIRLFGLIKAKTAC